MGNKACAKKSDLQFNLHAQFERTGIKQPWANQYENMFEKEFYMATNVFRTNPAKFAPMIKQVRKICADKFDRSDTGFVDRVCEIVKST